MLKTICRFSILGLAAIYLTGPFHSFDLRVGLFICAILIMVSAFPYMSRAFRRSAIFFWGSGAGLLLICGQPFDEWLAGMVSMLNIIAILAVMQLFSMPIQIGKYNVALETLYYRKFRNEFGLFFFVSLVTHLFASFLLFGTIPVMLSLFGDLLKRHTSDYRRFAATAISRGYALVILWAPGGVNILLILQTTGVSWADVFFPGLLLSLLGIGLSLLNERSRLSMNEPDGPGEAIQAPQGLSVVAALKKLAEVFAVIVGLVLLMVTFDWVGFATPTTRILFSGLLVAGFWLLHLRQSPGFRQSFNEYWNTGLLKTMDLSVLFICLGLFSTGVIRSGILLFIQPVLSMAASCFGPGIFLIGTPVIIVLSAIVGLHPFVSLVILGQMIVVPDLGVPMIPLALAMSLGGALSYIVSPFAGIVLTLSRFLGSRPTDIAWRWNWQFCVSYLILGISFIFLIR